MTTTTPTAGRSPARGAAAREAMLDAAEQIACESGLGAITLTAVQQRAGQSNKSAAAYHFGSRTGLLQAVIGRRMSPIDAERTRMLDAADPGDLPALVEALIRPLAEATALLPGSRWARFTGQLLIDPQLSELSLGHENAGSLRRVQALMSDLLIPGLGEEIATIRIASVAGLAISTLALLEAHPDLTRTPHLVDDLVATATAALSAPAPHTPTLGGPA